MVEPPIHRLKRHPMTQRITGNINRPARGIIKAVYG
jgi:hypothetical protein